MTFRVAEWHHLYLGIILAGVGLFVWGGVPLVVLGAVIVVDDAYQHAAGVTSPLGWVFRWAVARAPWLLAVTRWLDRNWWLVVGGSVILIAILAG